MSDLIEKIDALAACIDNLTELYKINSKKIKYLEERLSDATDKEGKLNDNT